MVRISESELLERLQAAQQQVPVGARYSHYKRPDRAYVIRDHALHEASESPLVLYEACYGEELVFARTLENFTEEVEHEGVRVPRFSPL